MRTLPRFAVAYEQDLLPAICRDGQAAPLSSVGIKEWCSLESYVVSQVFKDHTQRTLAFVTFVELQKGVVFSCFPEKTFSNPKLLVD
jgi:hypothetical protein